MKIHYNTSYFFNPISFGYVAFVSLCFTCLFFATTAEAATLSISPGTGVYTVGGVATARIVIDTAGKPINAAEGEISFQPNEISVLSVSKSSSIFGLWTIEPTFSNATGKISFGGGSPSGYSGSGGTVASVTFKVLAPGAPKFSFTSGSVLAADGQGTNVLSNMFGASYTVSAASANPEPEYVAPANTPKAPVVTSTDYPDQTIWYTAPSAHMSWVVPSEVTAVRTLLDSAPGTIPTSVYEPPIKDKVIEDLKEGASYFHVQFKNAHGWGKVTHYRLAKDTERPTHFEITEKAVTGDVGTKILLFNAEDAASGIKEYHVQIDNGSKTTWVDEKKNKEFTLPVLPPGKHTLLAEAVDFAGNALTTTYDFEVTTFDAPRITDVPASITASIIPVVKGTTRPHARVHVSFKRVASDAKNSDMDGDTLANDAGEFTFVGGGKLSLGVYDITAKATDAFGRESAESAPVRMIVEEPGYMRVGGMLVTALSVIVPLVALAVLLVLVVLSGWYRMKRMKGKIKKEVTEAEQMLTNEFHELVRDLRMHVAELQTSRKGKLTRAEENLINSLNARLKNAEQKVMKEIVDIDRVVKK